MFTIWQSMNIPPLLPQCSQGTFQGIKVFSYFFRIGCSLVSRGPRSAFYDEAVRYGFFCPQVASMSGMVSIEGVPTWRNRKPLPTWLQIPATVKIIEERKNPVESARNRQEFGARRQNEKNLEIHNDGENHANADQDETVGPLPQYANPSQQVEDGRDDQNAAKLERG